MSTLHVLSSPSLTPTALPFLKHTEIFIYPIAAVAVGYVIALLLQWNISMSVFHYYGFHDQSA
jgi:hypothetical protein